MQMSISDWNFYFEAQYGFQNREEVMKGFCAFIRNPNCMEYRVPVSGHVRIGGKVHNHDSFRDGAIIRTSEVKTFRKGTLITDDSDNMYTTIIMSTSDKVMSLVTAKGHVYSLDYIDRSPCAEKLIIDAIKGEINTAPGYYIDPTLRVEKGRYL